MNHGHISELAYAREATQAAVVTDWDADGQMVDHLEADPGSISQSLIEDMTLERSAFDERLNIKGVRNQDGLKIKMNWHGSEAVAADTVQVVQTPLMEVVEHCWGGQVRTKSTTCTGGTALIPILDSLDTIDEGVFISFEDQDDPGRCHIRRVISVNGGTKAVTLDQALPFVPSVDDPAHGTCMTYPDEDVLQDSTAGDRTFAWRLQRNGSEAVWEWVGTKSNLAINFARNAPPNIELSVMAGNFKHETLTKTTWTQTPAGQAPLACGRDTKLFLQTYGVNTNIDRHDASLAVETGVMSSSVDTLTEVDKLMEGRGFYCLARAKTFCTVNLAPFAKSWEVALQADTFYKLRYAQIAQAGKAHAIHFSRMEITETPKFGLVGDAQASSVKFKAHQDLANSAASNSKLWRAKIILVQA